MHNNFIESYLQFTNNLSEMIQNNLFISSSNDCYLVSESWNDELAKNINKYLLFKKNKIALTNNNIKQNNLAPKRYPIFINDFSTAIKYINKNVKFQLIDKYFIEYIYKNNFSLLKNAKCIQYYAKSNKLILDFEENNIKYALLIENPYTKFEIRKNTYIIQKNINFYITILSENKSIRNSKRCNPL